MRIMKWLSWLFVVIWMGVIFFLSHQAATESSELSSGITAIIVDVLQTVFPKLHI